MPIPTIGAIADVTDGQDILADWGNAVGASKVGRVVHRFASTANRDTAIPSPTRGMLCVTTDTDTLWQAVGASPAWQAVGAWAAYTPSWTAANSPPSLGNGTLVGRWCRLGKWVQFRLSLTFGSGTTGGGGYFSFGLPPAAAHGTGYQVVAASCFTSNGVNWSGFANIAPNATTLIPYFPQNQNDSYLGACANANSGGGAGTGCPLVPAAYSFTSGSGLNVAGAYEAA